MILRWTKLVDGRGSRRKICSIPKAMKQNGMRRVDIVQSGETPGLFVASVHAFRMYVIAIAMGFGYMEFMGGAGFDFLFSTPVSEIVVLIMILYIIGMGQYLHRRKWQSKEGLLRAMTRTGLCPSCGYSIGDREPEDDGCTVCSECGAAWRMDA
jgi:hypothetical protein